MRTVVIVIGITLLGALVGANSLGEIRGTLSGARGPIAGVEIRVKNVDTIREWSRGGGWCQAVNREHVTSRFTA